MSLSSLPDIAGMLVLMMVLAWFRNRHKDERVDGWLVGLYFILVEMIAASVIHGSKMLPVVMHVIALNTYLLAAITFGWTARRDLLPGTFHLPHYALPAIPMFGLATIFGLGIDAPAPYIALTSISLIGGIFYIIFFTRMRPRPRRRLILVHLVIWLPMLYLAAAHETRWVVYWGLACLYLLVAFSFGRRTRPEGIGGWIITVSFVIWAMCFLAYPLAQRNPIADNLVEQTWNIQKFFVVIGMLLVLLEDETQRRKDEALHDALTGLPNRRLFDDRLKLAVARSRRSGLSTAVFVIDLNGFKAVNDTFGHQVGDILLARVSRRLKRKLRRADTIARCGGDEFMVIVNDLIRPENCRRIADALRFAIQTVEIPGIERIRLGGSIGYAVFPEDTPDMHELCRLADQRMYEEKRAGKMADVEREIEVNV